MDTKMLSDQFLVDDDCVPEKLGDLIEKMLPHCVVRKSGTVDIMAADLSGSELVRLVLSARFVASKIGDSSVKSDVTVDEIAAFTGLRKNQVAARAKEAFDERFAERTTKGSYRARQNKIMVFLTGLAGPDEIGAKR